MAWIRELDVRAGMTVTSGQTLAKVNGLGTVWLDVAVPEALAQQDTGRTKRAGAAACTAG